MTQKVQTPTTDREARNIRIKEAMGREGHSRVKLASLLGIARETLSRKLAGKAEWRTSELERMAEIYDREKGFFF